MATRWAFWLTKGGLTKMIYNHWDSYPEWLGRDFVDRIKSKSDDELTTARNNIELLTDRAGKTGEEYWIEPFIEKIMNWPSKREPVQQQKNWGYRDWYIEYSYNYDIDKHELITEWNDFDGLTKLKQEIHIAMGHRIPHETIQPITVAELHKATAQLIKQGKWDKRIYLATDDEWNRFRPCYLTFTEVEPGEQREGMEDEDNWIILW
jgi:hypothetical protein